MQVKKSSFIGKITQGTAIFQYLAVITANLNTLACGFHYGWPSPSLPKLEEEAHISITSDQGSWIAALFLVGILCGANLGNVTLDRIGRKNLVILTAIPLIASWIMVAYARSVLILLIARFIAGICDGLMISALPVYIGEISNPNIRGFLCSSVAVTLTIGILLINVTGSYLTITTAALVSASAPILLLITFSFIPDSPYYLLMKGKYKEAERSLQIFRGTDDVHEELERLKLAVEEQNKNSGKYFDLFTTKSNRKALIIAVGVRTIQQVGGMTPITFYAQSIFAEANNNDISPSVAAITYVSLQLTFSVLCSAIVDKTGRRPLMIIAVGGSAIALFVEGTYFYIEKHTDIDTSGYTLIPIVSLLIFITISSLGIQVTPIILAGELFPTNVKAFAQSLMNSYLSILTTAITKLYQITKDAFGLHVPFYAFSVCSFLGLIFIILYVPETKGKTLEEIQDELKKDKKSKEQSMEMNESFRQISVY